ncbi:MAG: DUF3592 domain-containing protein [Candidatus Symbiothrix sp.]|jgi:hypothetical protein|nr:DUF3592 domain-containing protein [Candidatus Symbiothrix sp.]
MEYSIFVNIIFLIGVFFLLHFLYVFILSKQTKEWLSVEGKIYKSRLEVINQDIDDNMGVSHKLHIEYQYIIEGNTYCSERIFIGDYIRRNFSRHVKSLANKYAKDKKVLVYYNPNNLKRSVLETGVHPVIYRELFIGILFVVISIVMKVEESFFISLIQ